MHSTQRFGSLSVGTQSKTSRRRADRRRHVFTSFAAFLCGMVSIYHAHAGCNFDIDGNGVPDAATDGVLLVRHLLGFTGSALTAGALGGGATRDATQIADFINAQNFDLDGNGQTDAATDGQLAVRYLTGLNNAALSTGAVGLNPRRQTGADIVTFIQGGCNAADANLAAGVKIASTAVLNNLVEIKVQHGGAGQMVAKTDLRGDPTVAVGSTVLIQPPNNPLSSIALNIDTTLFENGHTIFGVRTARLDEVFSSVNINLSTLVSESTVSVKRAPVGISFKTEDAVTASAPSDSTPRADMQKLGVWFPRDDNGNGFNIDTLVVGTTAPPGSVGFKKLIIEAKDAVVWDGDGDISSVVQGPQLVLNGKLGLEDARIEVINEWPNTALPPKKMGIKVIGTWVTDVALKLTAGSITFSAADLLAYLGTDVRNNELDLGFGKIKGVRWDDGRINIGTIGLDLATGATIHAGINQVAVAPLAVIVTFYLGFDGKISAAAEVGYAYSAYFERGGTWDFSRQTFTPHNVWANGSFPNPNKEGQTLTPTAADYASKPTPTYSAKVSGTAEASFYAGIEAGVSILGLVPLALDNKIKDTVTVNATYGGSSATGAFGCISGVNDLNVESRVKFRAAIVGSKWSSWITTGFSAEYDKLLLNWSPPSFAFGGSLGACAALIENVNFVDAPIGSTTSGGFTVQLSAATATTAAPATITAYEWRVGDVAIPSGQTTTVALPAGLHDVKLTVRDSAGRSRELRRAITVRSLPGPVASFGYTPRDNSAGAMVRFDPSPSRAMSTVAGSSAITQYQWDFGDGTPVVTTSTPTVQSRSFAGGSYDVTLTVTTAAGSSNALTRRLWVGTQPPFTGYVATGRLNDTGVAFCGAASSGNTAPCLGTEPAGQDRYYGRDAAAINGSLTKIGGSAGTPSGQPNGFDYTKISNTGQALPASAALGGGANDWACTRDNVTGLIWEVKTTSGLRSMSHTYSWYQTNSPDGNNGLANGGSCATPGRCDTEKYAADVNASGLCGHVDWRIPTIKELEGIADLGRFDPAIDPDYFPNTAGNITWSATPSADGCLRAWMVNFYSGGAHRYPYANCSLNSGSYASAVRVVRGVQ